jgi:high-affinity Fe2+/Pb2+ permease
LEFAMHAPEPNQAAKKELSGAITWAVLSAAVAVGILLYAGKVDQDKRSTYFLLGAIGLAVAAVNGYSAWTLSKKAKPPAA